MAEVRTYLELSEDGGGSHKFYEVVVSNKTLTIRYGRIGDKGQTQVKDFPSPDKALAEANKKLDEKRKKGYAEAVMGERKKRSVTRREITSQAAAKNVTKAPVIWRFTPGSNRIPLPAQERCRFTRRPATYSKTALTRQICSH